MQPCVTARCDFKNTFTITIPQNLKKVKGIYDCRQGDLVFGFDLGFHSQMFRFLRNIASMKKLRKYPIKNPKQKHSLLQWKNIHIYKANM